MSEWQPIETAPINYPYYVLGADRDGHQCVMIFRRKSGWNPIEAALAGEHGYWSCYGSVAKFTPTHWMHLPEPPL